MNRDTHFSDLERLIDGDCAPEEASRIRAEIAREPKLADEARRLEALNVLLRNNGRKVEPAAGLAKDVVRRYGAADEAPRMLSRRALLTVGGLLAAGLAGFIVLPRPRFMGGGIDMFVTTFFSDFETYLLKDKVVDVYETNMMQLASWFGDRLPFALPPVSSVGDGAQLIGGRLCWLLERRLASLSYETDDGPMVLYIMNGDGTSPPPGNQASDIGERLSWHRSNGYASLVWRDGKLLYVMVGPMEVRRMMAIARSLFA